MEQSLRSSATSIRNGIRHFGAALLERANPASVGMSARGLADLKSQVNAMITKGERAGVVYAIARKGKIIALEALGKRNLERDLPMEANTAFRIYSMSRAVTSVAIARTRSKQNCSFLRIAVIAWSLVG